MPPEPETSPPTSVVVWLPPTVVVSLSLMMIPPPVPPDALPPAPPAPPSLPTPIRPPPPLRHRHRRWRCRRCRRSVLTSLTTGPSLSLITSPPAVMSPRSSILPLSPKLTLESSMLPVLAVVVVADHVAVTFDVGGVDVAGGAGVDHAAVAGGVAITERHVTEVQVDAALLHVLARVRARDLVAAQQIGVVATGELGLSLRRERCLRGERRCDVGRDAVVIGHRTLQADDRVAAAQHRSGRSRGRRDGLELCGTYGGTPATRMASSGSATKACAASGLRNRFRM